jgi:sulfite reductase alpha subunit-like flavoprotein
LYEDLKKNQVSLSAQFQNGHQISFDLPKSDYAYRHGDVQLRLNNDSQDVDIFLKFRMWKPEEDFKEIQIYFDGFPKCKIYPARFDRSQIELLESYCPARNVSPGEYVYSLQVVDDEDNVMQESSIIVTVLQASDD